ncbi:hypothetical protein OG864_29755 [Streptomyces sp. NBC_00124]|uniref:hypothetical protein n=1 Tax=Streptomyces sp. NBC_00124 TaxID=2975662 RepID=UPI002256CF1F|nr:hypothetical protein [Streptomyces sp. NBC_00124]MCX5362887.1 hypothetical protein [Streptomyces sp. NBC_00124]
MTNEQRVTRNLTVKIPRPSVRWSTIHCGGIVTAIATGHVHDHSAIWALVALGVAAHLSEAIAAGLSARRGP